jgi:RHS repeat-associated protein
MVIRGEAVMTRIRIAVVSLLALLLASSSFAQSGEEVVYFHSDAIGSVRLVTNANGQVVGQYDYLPFGEPWLAPALPETRRFGGKERDTETGLDYFGARYYASGNGRFTIVDPLLQIEAALVDPQRWNRYVYVRNNPFRFIDPDGRELRLAHVSNPYYDKFMQLAGSIRDSIANALGANSPGPHNPAADFGRQAIDSALSQVLPRNEAEANQVARDSISNFGLPSAPGGKFIGTTFTEAKTLVGAWAKGSWETVAASIRYHFATHGSEVGAKDVLQYLRKASEFSRNLRGATRNYLSDGKIRYEKNGRFLIKDQEGNILSFGEIVE